MLVDPVWQQHANDGAAKGYPYATWLFRDDKPGALGACHETKEQAESYAARMRVELRPRNAYKVIVTKEG